MADNVVLNPGTGGSTVAADDIGAGVLAQRVKPVWGADGVGNDASTATPLPVQPTPSTVGGWTPYSNTALSSTKQQVKASAGTVGGWFVYNANATVCFVQVWDVASGSITVGTTAPTYTLPIPAQSGANLEVTCGIAHATAINVAATTTATGSTAPTTALNVLLLYK